MEPLTWLKEVMFRIPFDELHPFAGSTPENDAHGSASRQDEEEPARNRFLGILLRNRYVLHDAVPEYPLSHGFANLYR